MCGAAGAVRAAAAGPGVARACIDGVGAARVPRCCGAGGDSGGVSCDRVESGSIPHASLRVVGLV